MKILAIETSCERASVALFHDDAVIERVLEGHANHSEHLLPSVAALLAEAGFAIGKLDAVAFGAGPGAFTGVRLACGVAQGLGMGAGLGIVPVCSLAALAMQSVGDVFAATDARMGEVYSAAYRVSDGCADEIQPPACTPPGALSLPAAGRWRGLGSAFGVYARDLPPAVVERLECCDPLAVPRAGDVARVAAAAVREGRLLTPELAAPIYVRDKVALTTAERLARGGRA